MTFGSRIIGRPHTIVLLLFVLVVASLFSISCRQIGDPAAQVELNGGSISACIHQCNATAKAQMTAEQQLHVTNIHNCTTDACRNAENARHEAAVNAISSAKEACQEACEHQGGATGGR